MRYIIKAIWEYALDFNQHIWPSHISFDEGVDNGSNVYAASMCYIKFPKPSGININMMPFKMSRNFRECQLPFFLKEYHKKIIVKCLMKNKSLENTICYLTINESFVQKGQTQRRPGIHCEHPGEDPLVKSAGGGQCLMRYYHCGHGGGHWTTRPVDGLFMASNVNKSCRIWKCKVDKVDKREIIGHLGDIEYLRKFIDSNAKRVDMKANELYWITDRTPHESLPMEESGNRQFFRIISSKLSTWYKQHNTPNPYGLMPDANQTQIVDINKFK